MFTTLLRKILEIPPGATDEDPAARQLMNDKRYGPLARNLIKLWYTGNWNQLPDDWRKTFGVLAGDSDQVVSVHSYQEGLVWPLIGAHPQGAKQQGFGAWAHPPVLPDLD
jgi:hypothetical protein